MEDAAFISNLVSALIDHPEREMKDMDDDDHFELLSFPQDILIPFRDRAFSWDVSLENDVSGELMAQQALEAYAKEAADQPSKSNKRTTVVVKPESHVNLLNNYQPSSSIKETKSNATENVQVKVEGMSSVPSLSNTINTSGIASVGADAFGADGDDLYDQVEQILQPFLQDPLNHQYNSQANLNSNIAGIIGNDGSQLSLSQQSPNLVSSSSYNSGKDHQRSLGSGLSINGNLVKPKVTIKLDSKPISASKGPDIKKTNEILKGFDHSTSIYLRHDFDSNSGSNNTIKRNNSGSSGSSNSVLTNSLGITMTSDVKRSPHMNMSMLQQQQQQAQAILMNNSNNTNNNGGSNSLTSVANSSPGISNIMNSSVPSTLSSGASSNNVTVSGGNTITNNASSNNMNTLNSSAGISGSISNVNLSSMNINNSGIPSIHKVNSTGSMANLNSLPSEFTYSGSNSGKHSSSMNTIRQSPYVVNGGQTNSVSSNMNALSSKDADLMTRNIMMNNAYNYADLLSMQQTQQSGSVGVAGPPGAISSGIPSPNMVHHHQQSHLQHQQLPHHRYSPSMNMEMSPYMMSSNMNMSVGGLERRVGAYTIEERRIKIEKFRERKRQRIWRKQIKYDCRKRLADTRPRVKGRFVSRKNLGSNTSINSLDGQDGPMSPDSKDYHDGGLDIGDGSDDDNSIGTMHHHGALHHQSGLNLNIHSASMGGLNSAINSVMNNGMNGMSSGLNSSMNSMMNAMHNNGISNHLMNNMNMNNLISGNMTHGMNSGIGTVGGPSGLNMINNSHNMHHSNHGHNPSNMTSELMMEIPFPPDLANMVNMGSNTGTTSSANSLPGSLNS